MKNKNIAERNEIIKRKSPWPKRIAVICAIILLLCVIFCGIFFPVRNYLNSKVSIKSIKKAWAQYDYPLVYEQAKEYLQEKPYNNTALTYYSYACFYLSQSQIDTQLSQEYLDQCINNIRIALYNSSKDLTPQLYYMLGRAYFYKNTISSHYYADLAVKYLLLARENGYEADDIPEYLGLSYASLGMTMESISAFTEALLIRESDSLLLSIAEQYYKLGEINASKSYLFRIIRSSQNEEIVTKCQNLLGSIYIDEENYEEAEKLYNEVIEKNPNSADAYFGLGVINEKQGNVVKARSLWRNALKVQVNHAGALQKLSEY